VRIGRRDDRYFPFCFLPIRFEETIREIRTLACEDVIFLRV